MSSTANPCYPTLQVQIQVQNRFTDLSLRSLTEGNHYDGLLPGFGIRVGKLKRTFFVIRNGKRTSIGQFPATSLHEARTQARQIISNLDTNALPENDRKLRDAVHEYFDSFKGRPNTLRSYRLYIDTHLNRKLGSRMLSEITPRDVLAVTDACQSQQHCHTALGIFFNWCVARLYIDRSPIKGLKRFKSPESRDRVLSDHELRLVWKACEHADAIPDKIAYRRLPANFATIVKLLILTGQRRTEIASLHTLWIKDDEIIFPKEITKNGREHIFPLGSLASQLLSELKVFSGITATANVKNNLCLLCFPALGSSTAPFNGWSKTKIKLDRISGVTDWTLHDLRRTFATIHGRIATPIHVTEKLLNHVSGSHGGIVGVYQRYAHADEKRLAMLKYEEEIGRIVA